MIQKIILFDVDGTLTPSGGEIRKDMIECLENLSKMNNVKLGIVGGGNIDKIKSQLKNHINLFKYLFCECGSVVYVNDNLVYEKNLLDFVNRDYLNEILRNSLKIISDMPIIFSGNQIDFRKGLIYISPPGMQSKNLERELFKKKDLELNLREKLINSLKKIDYDNLFDIVKGGEVGIALYPKKWDKSQILDFLKQDIENSYSVYFFGDKTDIDGNDYPLYSHPDVIGFSVKDYNNTIQIINKQFLMFD